MTTSSLPSPLAEPTALLDPVPDLPTSTTPTARLVELFSAIQGEGLVVGSRQLFVRFGGCDLRCQFCDSAHTWVAPATCEVEQHPGQRDFVSAPNPVAIATLLDWVAQLDQPRLHDSLSLTGGEPLLHRAFLQHFLPALKAQTTLPIYLETGGHRPQDLLPLLPYLDLVAADIKLPSVSGETHWEAHALFLDHCQAAGVETVAKVIVSADTDPEDLARCGALVAATDVPLILQPVTPIHQMLAPRPSQLLAWQAQLKQMVSQVRVIPQTHVWLGQR